jgi:hypothetical protein
MTLAQLGQHALVQRPRASSRLFLGQDAVASQDPAILPASVRAPPEEEHPASDGVGPAGRIVRIGQQIAERMTPSTALSGPLSAYSTGMAQNESVVLASTAPNRREA